MRFCHAWSRGSPTLHAPAEHRPLALPSPVMQAPAYAAGSHAPEFSLQALQGSWQFPPGPVWQTACRQVEPKRAGPSALDPNTNLQLSLGPGLQNDAPWLGLPALAPAWAVPAGMAATAVTLSPPPCRTPRSSDHLGRRWLWCTCLRSRMRHMRPWRHHRCRMGRGSWCSGHRSPARHKQKHARCKLDAAGQSARPSKCACALPGQ